MAEQLLEAIARGEYPAGSRLPGDREIAASTLVSRPTVREALLALEIVGAIEVQPGVGAKVKGPGDQWLPAQKLAALAVPREFMQTRALIEPIVAESCAQQIHPEALADLRTIVEQSAEATERRAPLAHLSDLGLRFHLRLAEACDNSVLGGIASHLVDVEAHPLWSLVNQLALRAEELRREQNTEHAAILDAIARGDANQARSRMTTHLERTNSMLFGAPESPSTATDAAFLPDHSSARRRESRAPR